ncbi:hypothetical protein [Anaerosporobacter faecicola]|uniref:hypothetical protein n=1 Tax=Anaerosporobacter faecicola TaxID=2718714 RepID=UPI00143C493C|nr:hypothetical protein [Anaerosporobacter faecicola]
MITFKVDENALKMIELKLDYMSVKAPEVLKKSINDTAKMLKNDLKVEVKKNYTAKVGGINKAISIKKATNKQIVAVVTVTGKPIPLVQFKNVADDSVRAKAIKRNKLKPLTLSGADHNGKDLKSFVAKMSNGHVGIFQRTPGKTMKGHGSRTLKNGKKTTGRDAIKQFYGNSIVKMVGNEDLVCSKVEKKANDYLKESLDKHIAKVLEGN